MSFLTEDENYRKILSQLQKPRILTDIKWSDIFRWLNSVKDYNKDLARDVLLRILEVKNGVPNKFNLVIEDYIEMLGLFPYVDIKNEQIGIKTILRYEFHRSENLPGVIMHEEQTEVISLLESTSIILSAPTSFGKSLLIDEIVSSNKYNNIVIIVPTLALIDETRIRLARYTNDYKLVFTTRQTFDQRNIMILTPERFLEIHSMPAVDFFIIDEFYKIGEEDERVNVLNQSFYKLLKMTHSFYLLGPNISSIPTGFEQDYDCNFKQTSFSTVVTDETIIIREPRNEFRQLIELLLKLDEPTLIYCQSPARAETCTNALLSAIRLEKALPVSNKHSDAINWIEQNVHSDWTLAAALKYDIAFHHGAMPRHLGRYVVNSFNEKNIKFIFCTSTLIEGVNTSARNVVIFDNKKANKRLSYFDYKNICGRAGRMNKYFMGKVFTFHNPPKESKVEVDFPWYTQTNASDEILIQIDQEDLRPHAKDRIREYQENSVLSLEVIQQNYGISVSGQISLAKAILSDLFYYYRRLSWKGIPNKEQLETVCDLIWTHLVTYKDGIFSKQQLAFYIQTYWRYGSNLPAYIKFILQNDNRIDTVDQAVQKAMSLVKKWFEFRFPKLLLALENIQREIFETNNLVPGEYGYFGSQIEYGFCQPTLSELQEFGIPISLLRKLEPHLNNLELVDIDNILSQVRSLDISGLDLHPYEAKLLNELAGLSKLL